LESEVSDIKFRRHLEFTFPLFGNKKKLRIGFGFGETVANEEPGSDALSKRAASEVCNKPALELSKRQR
jgi:hypothetical protein